MYIDCTVVQRKQFQKSRKVKKKKIGIRTKVLLTEFITEFFTLFFFFVIISKSTLDTYPQILVG